MNVIKLDRGTDQDIRAIVYKGELHNGQFAGYVWTIIEHADPRVAIEYAILCSGEEVYGVLFPDYSVISPDELSISEAAELIYADVIFDQAHCQPINSDQWVYLQNKQSEWVKTARVTFRLRRLRKLKELHAPKWIIKHEQILCIHTRTGNPRQDLINKYVRPILGEGSITVPDPD